MIRLNELAIHFVNHVHALRSATFACSAPTALEGWFRVELVPALGDIGIDQDAIDSRFIYPRTQQQADLSVRTAKGLVVFEFMHFVSHKDSRKIKRFPDQLNRLEAAVKEEVVRQAIAFMTFNGYSEKRQEALLQRFFAARQWQVTAPYQVMPGCPLVLVLAGFA